MSTEGLPHQTKYQHLADILRERLRTQPHTSRLPSVRSLMKRFQISQHTVMSALRILEEEGLISRKNGSGVYASLTTRPVTICFCRPQDINTAHDQREKALRDACQARGWKLVVARFEAQQAHFFAEDINADGFVLLPELVTFRSPLIGRIASHNTPVVIMGRDTSSAQLDFVTGDDAPVVRDCVIGLAQRGHRRITFLNTEPHFYEVQKRVDYFLETCASLGLEDCQVMDVHVQYGTDSVTHSEAFLQRYLAGLRPKRLPFTALLTGSAAGSIPAFRVFYDAGFRIPEDFSLCCLGADLRANYATPPLTNVAPHYAEQAVAATDILAKRMAGDKSPLLSEYVSYGVVWRASVGPPPKRSRIVAARKPARRG